MERRTWFRKSELAKCRELGGTRAGRGGLSRRLLGAIRTLGRRAGYRRYKEAEVLQICRCTQRGRRHEQVDKAEELGRDVDDPAMRCDTDKDWSKGVGGSCEKSGLCKEPSWCPKDPSELPEIYKTPTSSLLIWIKSAIQFYGLNKESRGILDFWGWVLCFWVYSGFLGGDLCFIR